MTLIFSGRTSASSNLTPSLLSIFVLAAIVITVLVFMFAFLRHIAMFTKLKVGNGLYSEAVNDNPKPLQKILRLCLPSGFCLALTLVAFLFVFFVFVFVFCLFIVFIFLFCFLFVCLEFQIIRFVISTFTPIFFISSFHPPAADE